MIDTTKLKRANGLDTWQVESVLDETRLVYVGPEDYKPSINIPNQKGLKNKDWVYKDLKSGKWLHVHEFPKTVLSNALKAICLDEKGNSRDHYTQEEQAEIKRLKTDLLNYIKNPQIFNEEEDKEYVKVSNEIDSWFDE